MSWNRPTLLVLLGSLATLAMATAPAPLVQIPSRLHFFEDGPQSW